MSNPSPLCEIKVGAAAYVTAVGGVDMTPSAAIIIKLSSQVDVDSWLIECATTDDTSDADTVTASLTIDSTNRTATFTAPSDTGKTYRFRSRVNGGLNRNGVADATLETTFCLYTTVNGRRCLAADETTEGDTTFGWIKWINDMIRDFGSGGGGGGGGAVGSNYQFQYYDGGSFAGATGLNYVPGTMLVNARLGVASILSAAIAQATLATGCDIIAPKLQGGVLNGTMSVADAKIAQAAITSATITSGTVSQATITAAMVVQATLATGCDLVAAKLAGAILAATTVYTGIAIAAVGDSKHRSYAEQKSASTSDASEGVLYAWNIKDEAVSTVIVEAQAVPSGGAGAAMIGRRAKIRADSAVATMGALENIYGEIDSAPGFTGANNPATGAAQASGFLRLWVGHSGMTGFVRMVGTPTGRITWGGTISRIETSWA